MKYFKDIIAHLSIILFLTVVGSIFLLPEKSIAQEPIEESGCSDCHSDINKLSELVNDHITFVIPDDFNEISIHKEIGCTGCHADPGGYPHPEAMGIVQCSECHSTESRNYLNSPHGIQSVASFEVIPSCTDCHTLHKMRKSSDILSSVHKNNEWATCTKCHQIDAIEKDNDNSLFEIKSNNSIMDFTRGIHSFKITVDENSNSLTCRDCHGFHSLSQELGTEWKNNFSTEISFCGECHTTEFESFNRSIHSTVSIRSVNGIMKLICSDCHIEHEYDEKISLRNEQSDALITDKCLECHLPVEISSRFSLNARGYTENIESIHGIKNLHGNLTFQNCSSCHGIHEINSFAKGSPEIVKAQISEYCGRCHPNASADFTTSLVHLATTVDSEEDLNISRIAMVVLVYAAFGVLLLLIIGDFYKKYRKSI